MNEIADTELDQLLARHLAARLDGQLGRAAAAFEDELRVGGGDGGRSRRARWRIGAAAAAAIAAGLVIAWMVPSRPVARPDEVVASPPAVGVAGAGPLDVAIFERATWSPVTDDGPALIDARPVRRLRQRMVEEVEWYDAKSRATVRTTIPRERIVLVGMRTD